MLVLCLVGEFQLSQPFIFYDASFLISCYGNRLKMFYQLALLHDICPSPAARSLSNHSLHVLDHHRAQKFWQTSNFHQSHIMEVTILLHDYFYHNTA